MTEHVVAGSLSMGFLVRASVFSGTRNSGAYGEEAPEMFAKLAGLGGGSHSVCLLSCSAFGSLWPANTHAVKHWA